MIRLLQTGKWLTSSYTSSLAHRHSPGPSLSEPLGRHSTASASGHLNPDDGETSRQFKGKWLHPTYQQVT